jgi:hypothetical protein
MLGTATAGEAPSLFGRHVSTCLGRSVPMPMPTREGRGAILELFFLTLELHLYPLKLPDH